MVKEKILIIDDDEGTRKTLSDIFKEKGYEPCAAKNGTEGLALLKQAFVNVVVIDLGLPDMSGLEVLKRVKEENPATETIILTGNASLHSAIEATNRGTYAYLLKPYDMDQLTLHIRRALEKQHAHETIVGNMIGLQRANAELNDLNAKLTKEVTERKQREKELRESTKNIVQAKQEWESLVDSFHELIFLLDDKGCAIRSNRRLTDWGLGQLTDIKGEKLHDIIHPYCQKSGCYLKEFISKGLRNSAVGKPTELEVKDEVLKLYLDIRMRPIRTQRNKTPKQQHDLKNSEANRIYKSFAVLVIHDITERRQAKESLAEAYGELEETQQELIRIEKLALLGKFSSGIAHEIRNPLANIRASAQFCLAQYKLNKEIRKHLGIMLRNSEHANKIIKDLIDLAKPSEVSLKPGKISDLINRVCDLVKTRCEKQHILMHTKISRRLPPILMDEERMEKAFLNFVLNALDAMPKGGKLTMNVYPHFDKNKVIITIQDTGKGIPQEDFDNIFHPFFTTKRTGIGLGLCLADQVISSHKGGLSIASKTGEGTTIKIELPIARED